MIKPNLSKWAYNDSLRGLLIFSQKLQELLFHHTVDSFKAPALNTHTRILEYGRICDSLAKNRISVGTLKPFTEELKNSLRNDPVLNPSIPSVFSAFEKMLTEETFKKISEGKTDAAALGNLVEGIEEEIDKKYWAVLKQKIIDAVASPVDLQTIKNLATVFVVEVELRGFSKRFLYLQTLQFFFNPHAVPASITSPGQIEDFFRIFDVKNIEWSVIFRANGQFLNYLENAEPFGITVTRDRPELPASLIQYRINEYLSVNEDYPAYVIINQVSAKEMYIANRAAVGQLEAFVHTCKFYDHQKELKWQTNSLVMKQDKSFASIISPEPNAMGIKCERDVQKINDKIKKSLQHLLGYNTSKRARWLNVFDYHYIATQSEHSENQLLSLWAALEGFLPPPTKDSDRISHYVRLLVPVLSLTYPEKIFRYVVENLNFSGSTVKSHVENFGANGDFFEKTLTLLTTKEHERDRNVLYSQLAKNPLLLERCKIINSQYRSTAFIKQTLESHKQRVKWHLQRIYTTRNQIMHSATSLPYLGTLVSNLHAYLDTLFESLMRLDKIYGDHFEPKEAISLLALHEEGFINDLTSEIECDKSNYKILIFGKNNPLSPFIKEE